MADEPVKPAESIPTEEAPSTLDRALDFLQKPEEPAAAAPAAPPAAEPAKAGTEPAKPAEAKPGEPAKPAEAKPAETPAATEPFKVGEEAKFKISDTAVKTKEEIEKLPYANDASFKAIMGEFETLAQFKIGMGQALNEVESAGKYVIPDADTMKAVVADAYNLYDVINLHKSPIELLELAAKNYGEENINQVIAQILNYAEEKGITKDMYSDLTKPENKKIFELAKESRERKAKDAETQTANQTKAEAEQKTNDLNSLETHIGKWAKENKVDESDVLDYLTFAISYLGVKEQKGKDGKIEYVYDQELHDQELKNIRAGKFGGIEKILTEYNNRMVERQSRWEKSLTERKGARDSKLQGAAPPAGGGTPPAEPPKKKVNFNDDDERLDRVKAALRE